MSNRYNMRSVKHSIFQYFQHNSHHVEEFIIDSKTRQSYKKCRLGKCLQVGMKIMFVQKQAVKYENKTMKGVVSLSQK